MINTVCHGDNLYWLRRIKSASIGLIYIDPPYNTGIVQKRSGSTHSYNDSFVDYKAFLYPRLKEAYRVLADSGSLFLQIDYREVHYVKVWLDGIFKRDNFINQIIWSYDFGARSKKKDGQINTM
jgi:site-specific DNA-methyltransferase (adenine-specific)